MSRSPRMRSVLQHATNMVRGLGHAAASVRLEPMAGDASTRRYYRVRSSPEGAPTFCLMELPEPYSGPYSGMGPQLQADSRSSDLGPDDPREITELPFLNIQRYLVAVGAPAPAVLAANLENGLLLLEDLGDTRLVDALPSASPESLRGAYREAIDNLARMQAPPSDALAADCQAFHYAFTEDTFTAELHYFAQHMLAGMRNASAAAPGGALHAALTEAFAALSRALLDSPLVFTHRDYHSRNLMLHDGRQVIIDFQDARLGPPLYDLASLLFDSYWPLDDAPRRELMAFYRQQWRRRRGSDLFPDDFDRRLRLAALQRNLKAIGTFASMPSRSGSHAYEPFIAPTLQYVRQHLAALPECEPLQRLLARWLPEIA